MPFIFYFMKYPEFKCDTTTNRHGLRFYVCSQTVFHQKTSESSCLPRLDGCFKNGGLVFIFNFVYWTHRVHVQLSQPIIAAK